MIAWVATYGIKQPRGGWLLTEQNLLQARNYQEAHKMGLHMCKRGEALVTVEEIPQDLDLLDYDSMDVI